MDMEYCHLKQANMHIVKGMKTLHLSTFITGALLKIGYGSNDYKYNMLFELG